MGYKRAGVLAVMAILVVIAAVGTLQYASATPEDVDGNGVVNIFDVLLVGEAFGQVKPTPEPTFTPTATATPTPTATPVPTPSGYHYGRDDVTNLPNWPVNVPGHRLIFGGFDTRTIHEKPLGVPEVNYEYDRFNFSPSAVEDLNLRGLDGWRFVLISGKHYLVERIVGAPIVAHEYMQIIGTGIQVTSPGGGWRVIYIDDDLAPNYRYILERELP